MNQIISPKLTALTFGVLAVSFLAAFYAIAWQEPSQAPPAGNVPAPLNVGSTGQSKSGGLILNTGGAATGLIVDKGNVGIGTANPQKKLDVSEGDIRTGGEFLTASNEGSCPLWKDCDGDAKTGGSGDCDEGCSACYVGSANGTGAPDGKDQDCNGVVDDIKPTNYKSCTGYGVPGNMNCLLIGRNQLQNYCTTYCASLGLAYNSSGCDPDQSPAPSYWGNCGSMCGSVEFSSCTLGKVPGYADSGFCYLGTASVCGTAKDYAAWCQCSGYQ